MNTDDLTDEPRGLSPTPSPDSDPGFFAALRRNLMAGCRLAAGCPVTAADITGSPGQVLALLPLLLLVEFSGGYLTTDAPAVFDSYGLNYLGAVYLFDLVLLVLALRLAGGGWRNFAALVTGFAAALVPIALVTEIVWMLADRFEASGPAAWATFVLLLVWQWLVLVRLLRGLIGASHGRALVSGFLFAACLFAGLWIFPQTSLWYTDASGDSSNPYGQAASLDVEDVFYAQPQLMHDSLARLKPQRPGVTDLYFLALGGYGLEDVFLKEVEYVRGEFDRRYGTAGRSLILANNPATVARYPLANRHNLVASLGAIAQRMDTAEDVLFLFMTSHGSRDHRFSLELGPVKLDDLTPQQLRQALDNAGIRWRVIVVSSCFSGGFVEPLETPDTLVITAAAADRTSFGCGSDSDFTWFGTAYFKQGLVRQPKFVEAFDIAARWVSDKETREQFTPSRPQRFVGKAIAQKLDDLYAEPALRATLAAAETEQSRCGDGENTEACR